MSADIALRNLAPFLLLLPGMALVIWFGVGTGLRPLHRLAADLQQRQSGALEPVAVERLPMEITPLVHALNDLLGRLAHPRRAAPVYRRRRPRTVHPAGGGTAPGRNRATGHG